MYGIAFYHSNLVFLPWRRCSANRAKFCTDRKTLPCLQNASQHITFLHTTAFNHEKRCMNENTIQCLPNPSQHVPSTVSQLFDLQVQKIAVFTYRRPHFCFSWRRPCDYHAMCCMDGKTIQCLPNPLQHVPIYFQ